MSEDLTQGLPQGQFQERVLSELAAINGRLTTLEDRVERRLQETRPIWEDVQTRLRQLDGKFDLVIKDLYEVRSEQAFLSRRVERLEKQN